MLSESRLRALTPDQDVDLVSQAFTRFRQLLWEFIEVSADPNTHTLAWNTIDIYGKVGLAEYQATGSHEALERVKNIVKVALELL